MKSGEFVNQMRFIRPQYFDMWMPKVFINDAVMNYGVETMGAEFVSLNENIVENSGAIRFILQVIKGKFKEIKKEVKDGVVKSV